MIQWLYRYIFRGLGLVMLVGMLTIVILAIASQSRHAETAPVKTGTVTRP